MTNSSETEVNTGTPNNVTSNSVTSNTVTSKKTASSGMSLRQQLAGDTAVVAPGGYDGLSAALIEKAGFGAMYLSGASIAYTRFGRPDIGLVSMAEVAQTLSAICERTALPVIVDADTGFGNALNVYRTVQLFERLGAAAIQLEDQQLPKRCGHLPGKTLVSCAEMQGKLNAALDARSNDETLIVARTDAIAVEGFEPALERAERYLEAGADILFIEAPQNLAQMQTICSQFAGRIPLLANMVEGGDTPVMSAEDLAGLGYRLVIFPGAMVRVQTHATQRYLAHLKANGSTRELQADMLNFNQLNQLLGTREILELGASYGEDQF